MEKFIKNIFQKLKINISDKKIKTISQFIKFGIVGATNTLLSYLLYLGVLLIMKPFNIVWDLYAASIISFVLSVLWSFYWNNRFVFKSEKGQRNILKSLLKTYISYGFTGFILSNILLFVWTSLLGIPKEIAPLLSLIITVPVNFILNKFWAFKNDKKKQ